MIIGEEIDLESDWKRLHIVDAVKEATGVNFYNVKTDEEAKALAKAHGIENEVVSNLILSRFLRHYIALLLNLIQFVQYI
jgi:lysyl-tRNA synthetase class II